MIQIEIKLGATNNRDWRWLQHWVFHDRPHSETIKCLCRLQTLWCVAGIGSKRGLSGRSLFIDSSHILLVLLKLWRRFYTLMDPCQPCHASCCKLFHIHKQQEWLSTRCDSLRQQLHRWCGLTLFAYVKVGSVSGALEPRLCAMIANGASQNKVDMFSISSSSPTISGLFNFLLYAKRIF